MIRKSWGPYIVFCLFTVLLNYIVHEALRARFGAGGETAEAFESSSARDIAKVCDGRKSLSKSFPEDVRRALQGADCDASRFVDPGRDSAGRLERKAANLAKTAGGQYRKNGGREFAVLNLLSATRGKLDRLAKHVGLLEKRLENEPHKSISASEMKGNTIYPTVQLKGRGTVGSGVIVFSGPADANAVNKNYVNYILTAYHVVLEVTEEGRRDVIEPVRLMGEGNTLQEETYRAYVHTFDRSRDIALLELDLDRLLAHVATFIAPEEIEELEVFEPAYAVGCPLGNKPIPSAGQISTKRKVVNGQVFWMVNAPTFFGNSGGGIFRASDGKLIGISSMVYTYGRSNSVVVPHLGLFVPASEIFDWLAGEGYGFIYKSSKDINREAHLSSKGGVSRSKLPGGNEISKREGSGKARSNRVGTRISWEEDNTESD